MAGLKLLSTAIAASCATLSAAISIPNSGIICPIVMDGRVPTNMALSTFDTSASPFNPNYVLGQNLTWSQVLEFPKVEPSKFDIPADKAIEVTLTDSSIFVPGG